MGQYIGLTMVYHWGAATVWPCNLKTYGDRRKSGSASSMMLTTSAMLLGVVAGIFPLVI